MTGKSQNTVKTQKRTVPKSAWKKGQSGNPGGRPKNEQSISHWMSEYLNMSPAALADRLVQYAKDLKTLKGDAPLAGHVAIRAIMSVINEPSPGLLALIFERTEGKVPDKLEIADWRKDAQEAGIDPDELVHEFFAKVKHDAP